MNRLIALLHPQYRFRSSVTGHFVSKWYALTHPKTTEKERVEARDEGDRL